MRSATDQRSASGGSERPRDRSYRFLLSTFLVRNRPSKAPAAFCASRLAARSMAARSCFADRFGDRFLLGGMDVAGYGCEESLPKTITSNSSSSGVRKSLRSRPSRWNPFFSATRMLAWLFGSIRRKIR